MREALALAERAMEVGEAPIAALIADLGTRTIIGRGWNELNAKRDRTAHAEIVAFRDAAGRYDVADARLILVSTLEPCIMCLSAAVESAVETVVWGYPAPLDAGASRVEKPQSPEARWPTIIGHVMPDASRALFERWLALPGRSDRQRAYITKLLDATKNT